MLHNQTWWPSCIIDRVNGYERGPTIQGVFGSNVVSFHPVVLKKILKAFQFFHTSETLAVILDVGQGDWTQFWKRTIQGVSHPFPILSIGH